MRSRLNQPSGPAEVEGVTDNVDSGGAVAQVVERDTGSVEVRGSSPLSSTLRGEARGNSGSGAQECPSARGARAELAIATALARGGWDVYLPFFSPHSRVDLVVNGDGGLCRVQCKTSRLRGDVLMFATCSNTGKRKKDYRGEIDLFGVYSPELDTVYLVPVGHTATRACSLRLAPARNGQTRGVRFAVDYLVQPTT